MKNADTKNAVIENLWYTQSCRLNILFVFLLTGSLFFKGPYHHKMINYNVSKQTLTQKFEPALKKFSILVVIFRMATMSTSIFQ